MTSVEYVTVQALFTSVAVQTFQRETVIVTATYLTSLAYVVATVLLTLTLTEYVTM